MRLIILAAALAAALLSTAGASHCETYSSSPYIWSSCDQGAPYCYYWAWDWCQPSCLLSYWYYQESNGLPGLQRGDEVVDDTCHGMVDSDTILW